MIVVFDTNIWKSNLYLRSPAGGAVQQFLRMKSAKVGLPEVVKLEVERHLQQDLKAFRKCTQDNFNKLLGVFGKLQEVVLPSDNDIERVTSTFFQQSGFAIFEVPFTLKSAHNSFIKTIDKIRPSHKSQQFKDGVLWADCLTLAEDDEVVLVSSDHAFYKDDDPTKGLDGLLVQETASTPHSVRILSSLQELLEEIKSPIEIDDEELRVAIEREFGAEIAALLERANFSSGTSNFQTALFATGASDSLYLEFSEDVKCNDLPGEGRIEALLHIAGDGRYDPLTKEFSQLRQRNWELVLSLPRANPARCAMFTSMVKVSLQGVGKSHIHSALT
jgi:PIN domain